MRLKTQVVLQKDNDTHWLSVDVDSDVISFYLDDKLLFMMDFEGNFDEFITTIMQIWGGWTKTSKKEANHK